MPETNESSMRAGLPNPLRLPLLLVVGVAAAWVCRRWVGGTGGLDVSQFPPAEPWYPGITLVSFLWNVLALPVAALLGVGLLVAWMRSGTASALAGLRFMLGSQRPGSIPGAARFLSVVARVVTWGGVLVGFAACGFKEVATPLINLPSEPEGVDTFRLFLSIHDETGYLALFVPLAGIVLGRFVLGALAEGARIWTDKACASAFSPLQDLVLLGLFAVPWYQAWYLVALTTGGLYR